MRVRQKLGSCRRQAEQATDRPSGGLPQSLLPPTCRAHLPLVPHSVVRSPMGAMGCNTHTPIVCLRVQFGRQERVWSVGRSVGRGVACSIEAITRSTLSSSLPRVALSLPLSLPLPLPLSCRPLPIVSALFSFLFYFRRPSPSHAPLKRSEQLPPNPPPPPFPPSPS